jgi:hypothetical protein
MTLTVPTSTVAADDAQNWDDPAHHWPQWRGPLGTGVAPHADPPVDWSETKNVRWKTVLPGQGHSTPIVWQDRVFVTAAVPYGDLLEPKYSNRPGAHDNVPVTRHHRFAVLTLSFWPQEDGGRIELVHVNVHDDDFAGVSQGWEKYYWTPWRTFLLG